MDDRAALSLSRPIIVVGAGISGLALAHALREKGAFVRVLEATDRVGGVIRTLERDGFLLETAANGYLDKEPATRELVLALGLGERVRAATPASKVRSIYTRGALRKVPSSPPAFLRSSVVPLATKLRMAAELFSRRGSGEDESLAQFARRHIGERATAVLIDAVQTGIFAGDIDRLSAPATFPRMVALERRHRSLLLAMFRLQRERRGAATSGPLTTFDVGMEALPTALAAALGDDVQLDAPVQRLMRHEGQWRVVTPSGEFDASQVVLTTPADVSASLLEPIDAEVASTLRQIRYAPLAVVHLCFRNLPEPPEGFGFLVPKEERRRVLGALFVSNFFPHRAPPGGALLTVMVGGARQPELVREDDDALQRIVRDELREIIGLTAEPDRVEVVRWTRGIPQYEIGHLARVARLDALLARHEGLHLAGNAFRGVGVNDCIREARLLAARMTGAGAGTG